jgi:hypothetical protein
MELNLGMLKEFEEKEHVRIDKYMGSKKYSGLWWLPTNPQNKISGTLSYECGQTPTLSLDGLFLEDTVDEYHEIILGDDRGNRITLVGCFRTNLAIHSFEESKEFKQSEFHVSFFCTGFHFATREELKFKSLTVCYSHLREWLRGVFDLSRWDENDDEYILRVKKPPVREIVLDRFSLRIGGYVSSKHGGYHDSFERYASITIDMTDEKPLDELFSIIYHLKNLLSLATSERISILTMSGKKKGPEHYERVEIFSSQTWGEKGSTERFAFCPVHIEYRMISDRLEFYLKNWFDTIEKYEPMYELFFGTLNERIYPVQEFLSLAQALEAYHCRKFENRIVADDQFMDQLPKFQRVIEEFPLEHRPEFQSKLEFMNRRSLRRRTRDLFGKHDRIFKIFIKEKEDFISKFVVTRNYYTHYEQGEEEPAGVMDLPFLTENLRFMLMVILFDEMGFEMEQIEQIIHRYCRGRIRAIYQ